MRLFTTSALVLALLFTNTVYAGRFEECLDDVRNGEEGLGRIGATDNNGNILDDVRGATGLTYGLCVKACGPEAVPFRWPDFSKQFSAWLLPWLAMISQLPFGPKDRLDNLESVLLTIGSPTLAAYSLALTILNTRWITRRFARCAYPNARNAVRTLSSLQQAPLRVTNTDSMLASLVILRQNDEWWKELMLWLQHPHTWTISAVTSIIWGVLAFVFTVVEYFTGDIQARFQASGQGVGSLWLWLLPIVMGWLQVSPKCDEQRIRVALERANALAYVASERQPVPARSISQHRAIYLAFTEDDELRADERITAPVYNYARFLPWVQSVEEIHAIFKAASRRRQAHESVDPSIPWVDVEPNERPREENRTGNTEQIALYGTTQGLPLEAGRGRSPSRWGPNIVSRIAIASFLALLLQWGTVGGSIVINYFTPTTGLGCRSGSYVVFGALSTLVWIFLLVSSILSHFAVGLKDNRAHRWPRVLARWISIGLRRLGKVVAAFNAIWILLTCFFHFGNFYDRCYCNSSVFGRRDSAYSVILLDPADVPAMKAAWIGGTCLAAGTAVIFVGFIATYINPVLPDEVH
ncbi:hypothetical protein NMY22_g14943 [Coprinellus aureogranulatus]|nr:hypothetical protein NMY22_g14943 [Coprinellus aureogranulatus]